jgi:hypothetical protein
VLAAFKARDGRFRHPELLAELLLCEFMIHAVLDQESSQLFRRTKARSGLPHTVLGNALAEWRTTRNG